MDGQSAWLAKKIMSEFNKIDKLENANVDNLKRALDKIDSEFGISPNFILASAHVEVIQTITKQYQMAVRSHRLLMVSLSLISLLIGFCLGRI